MAITPNTASEYRTRLTGLLGLLDCSFALTRVLEVESGGAGHRCFVEYHRIPSSSRGRDDSYSPSSCPSTEGRRGDAVLLGSGSQSSRCALAW